MRGSRLRRVAPRSHPEPTRASNSASGWLCDTAPGAATWPDYAALGLVFLAVVFNALLAVVNAQVTPLSSGPVAGCEVAIVIAAHMLILRRFRLRMLPWYGLIAAVVLFALFRTAMLGHFEAKYARDVLLIPTFLMLGMTVSAERTRPLVVALHIVVVAGVLFEAFFTEAYSALFRVRDYYIATRSFDDSAFWNASSDLFVSATRPDERFFSFVDLHRVSSVFLEPVTLGNYVIIITIYLVLFYRQLGLKLWSLLAAGNLIALVGCDGRLATLSSLIIIAVSMVARHLPRRSSLLYLPLALIGAVILSVTTGADPRDDDFLGRIAYCVNLLSKYGVWDWMGLSDTFVGPAADSGIAYLVTTQSVFGLALIFVLLVTTSCEQRAEQVRGLHAVTVFSVLTLLISYSLFSIKTAALLWFVHGALQNAVAVPAARPWLQRGRQAMSSRRLVAVAGA